MRILMCTHTLGTFLVSLRRVFQCRKTSKQIVENVIPIFQFVLMRLYLWKMDTRKRRFINPAEVHRKMSSLCFCGVWVSYNEEFMNRLDSRCVTLQATRPSLGMNAFVNSARAFPWASPPPLSRRLQFQFARGEHIRHAVKMRRQP